MSAKAKRFDGIGDGRAPRPYPRLVPRRTPSAIEIDAFVRGSETRIRPPGRAIDEAPPEEVATVGAVMSFVERTKSTGSVDADERDMERRLRVGDYDGALVVASVLVYRDASHWRARRVKAWCAHMSKATHIATEESPYAVLSMAVEWDALADVPLTREESFVLSLVDGVSTVSEVLDASALPRPLAMKTLESLLAARLVLAREPVRSPPGRVQRDADRPA
jgi:hypothetical protein